MKRIFVLLILICFAFVGCSTSDGNPPILPVDPPVEDYCDSNLPSVPGFCEKEYLDANPDVGASEFAACASVHYLLYGKAEGRDPCPVKQMDLASYRGVETDGRTVWRWSKPGSAYPAGVKIHYFVNGEPRIKIVGTPSADYISHDPNQFYWVAESKTSAAEWKGKLVVMLPQEATSSYSNHKKGQTGGCWLEY